MQNGPTDPVTLTFWPKSIPPRVYPKVIPCTQFEHFGVIRFWVMLQTNRRSRTTYPRRPTVSASDSVGVGSYCNYCESVVAVFITCLVMAASWLTSYQPSVVDENRQWVWDIVSTNWHAYLHERVIWQVSSTCGKPCAVWQWLSMDYCYYGRSKPGWQTMGPTTRKQLTIEANSWIQRNIISK